MKRARNYREYKDYINHQKDKTTDPIKRKKWLNEEWELKLNGFKKIFNDHSNIIKSGMRALCIGARTGQEVVALKEMGVDAVGIDIVPHPPNVIAGDMHNLEFEDDSFDFVFSNVFDHSLYPDRKISEIERVLKTDGYALLQFLTVNSDHDQYSETFIDSFEHDILTLFKESFCVINSEITKNFAGMNHELIIKKDQLAISLKEKVGEIKDISIPEEYYKIWNEVNLPIQLAKGKSYNLEENYFNQSLNDLSRRAYYLVSLAEYFNVKNIVEVGTAYGYQFYSFAHYAQKKGGKVYSCDIKDIRNEEYKKIYSDCTVFSLGDSKTLAPKIKEKIDMFYIDGAHDYGDVVNDVVNLKEVQSDNPIWVFDDFDTRFGCYRDIKRLCNMSKSYKIYNVGNTTSGNPNHQIIIFGKF